MEEDEEIQQIQQQQQHREDDEHHEDQSRPTTPKWWRPPIPPETYLWEEMRRRRQRGGYPWTYLDRHDDTGDNLYEPVNPPPMYGSGYNVHKDPDTTSLDERMIEIPPDCEFITSDGLDGLDMPDNRDFSGVDGDREWHSFHPDPEDSQGLGQQKAVFTAGIRGRGGSGHSKGGGGETSSITSSVRPLTNKTISFSPDVPPDDVSGSVAGADSGDQQVPTSSAPLATEQSAGDEPGPSSNKRSALEQLKSKAGQVKQRISKISLPVRPKFNQWTGIKLAKRKGKKTQEEVGGEENMEVAEQGGWTEPLSLVPEAERPKPSQQQEPSIPKPDETIPAPAAQQEQLQQSQDQRVPASVASAVLAESTEEAENKRLAEEAKKKAEEELKRLKAEEKAQRDRELEEVKRLKEQEKLQKQKEAEEQKRVKAEEKVRKDEELKRQKADEKLRKEKEKEDVKRQKAEEKLQKDKLDEELRRAKEEEIQRSKELQRELEAQMAMDDDDAQEIDQLPESQQHQPEPEPEPVPEPKAVKAQKTPEKKRKLIDIDFTKRFKRSKTPPPRPDPPKMKFSRKSRNDPTQNQLAAQYGLELEQRQQEAEEPQKERQFLREPQIFVTQPSVETTESETSGTTPQQPRAWPFEERHHSQQVEYDEGNEEDEQRYEENDDERVPTPSKQSQARENISRKLKGFGQKSKAIAAQTGKNLGQTMKAVGHGIKEFGVNAVQEVKAKQEAVRQRDAQKKADREQAIADGTLEDSEPKMKFRFRRRDNKGPAPSSVPDEGQMVLEELDDEGEQYARHQDLSNQSPGKAERRKNRKVPKDEQDDDQRVHRSQLLGRADRDWESPLDLAQSRDASEEPFSGQASSRDSPPGSSMASSSIHHGRRQGVLEEIDSDEFFLRERGISEGEDEEEVNRFLVEELRQAFRPTMTNALEGFDLPSPPSRPGRSPKKPPRKTKSPNNFQTFPPERPKRKQAGYISAYINANPEDEEYQEEEEEEEEEDRRDNTQEDEQPQEDINSIQEEEDEDEGIRRVKEELRKIDRDLEDDGRYEPVNEDQDEPVKPQRRRRKQPKLPPAQESGFYYNTIAANEWMRDLEGQIETEDLELNLRDDQGSQPVPPKRVKSKSGSLVPEVDNDSEIHFVDDEEVPDPRQQQQSSGGRFPGDAPPLAQAESGSRLLEEDLDDALDYVDEAGYAVVHKDVPRTFPRKKKKTRPGSKGNSLKRRSQEVRQNGGSTAANATVSTGNLNGSAANNNGMFFSLPRYTPRTFHIVPPTRPHRTYSTLKPKRPPRNKTKSNQNLSQQDAALAVPASPSTAPRPLTPVSPISLRREEDSTSGSRPSTAIGIMQGRPLPPPPRPERSPAPLNDLDQASIERMVNLRHYANFDDEPGDGVEVIEEPCRARNIPLLTHGDAAETSNSNLTNSEINVAVQTDPVHDEDYELNIAAESFEDEDERIEKQSSVTHLPSDDQEQEEEQVPPPIPERPLPRSASQQRPPITPPQIVFPTRLHLDELEVDVLRVNDLTANILSLTQIHAPHLELNSLSSRGPLSVPSITTPNLTVDNLDCNRLSSDAVDLPSIPPPSFYQLSSPMSQPASIPSVEEQRSVDSDECCPDQEQDSSCPPPPCSEETTTTTNASSQQEAGEQQQQRVISRRSTPAVSAPVTRSSTLPEPVTRGSSFTADPDLEDIAHLSMRLGRALLRVTVRSLHAMAEYVEVAASNDPNCSEQQRANMQVLLCLLLVLVAGVILVSRGGSIEPRWQYFLPPSDL